jgi:hypothetical protein
MNGNGVIKWRNGERKCRNNENNGNINGANNGEAAW